MPGKTFIKTKLAVLVVDCFLHNTPFSHQVGGDILLFIKAEYSKSNAVISLCRYAHIALLLSTEIFQDELFLLFPAVGLLTLACFGDFKLVNSLEMCSGGRVDA